MEFCTTQLRLISHEVLKISIHKMSLKDEVIKIPIHKISLKVHFLNDFHISQGSMS